MVLYWAACRNAYRAGEYSVRDPHGGENKGPPVSKPHANDKGDGIEKSPYPKCSELPLAVFSP